MLRPLFAPFFTSALFAACQGAQPMQSDLGAGGSGGEPWGGAFAATTGMSATEAALAAEEDGLDSEHLRPIDEPAHLSR